MFYDFIFYNIYIINICLQGKIFSDYFINFVMNQKEKMTIIIFV